MAISEERAKCERENTVFRACIRDLEAEVERLRHQMNTKYWDQVQRDNIKLRERAEAAEAEVKRLHDLHLERTHLTTRMIKERDAAEAKLAAIKMALRKPFVSVFMVVERIREIAEGREER